MYSKNDLITQLNKLNIDPKGTLKVHSSYKAIGEVEGRADTVLDALMEYMEAGLLVLPSHTWNNVGMDARRNNPVMDVLHTPSCVGILTEMFRKRKNVYRSFHPTHSVAAFSSNTIEAENYVSGEEKISTPCGIDGVYYKLWERNAQILLIGVNFTRNTFIHGIEEWENAADETISDEKTDLYVIDYQGNRIYTPQYRHCARIGSETFGKLEAPAIQSGILSLGRFGDATTRLVCAAPLREMTAELLRDDIGYLLKY